jgi:MoaA/NifB/PqqE/SkfB family radical SAM enzyme
MASRTSAQIYAAAIKNIFLPTLGNVKPSFYYKLIKGMVDVKLRGRKAIQYIEINTTNACNAACDFCSNAHYDKRPKQERLTKEKITSLIGEAADMGIPVICFLGGEPMLDPNIFDYVECTWKHGMLPNLGSNGQLFNRENLARLKKAHVGSVSVTIHSADPARNAEITRLPNYLPTAIEAVRLGRSLGVTMNLKTVVGRSHFESGDIYRIVELARELGVWLSINPVVPTGAAHDNYSSDILTDALKIELDRLVTDNTFITTHLTSNYFGYGCPAGRAYMGISTFGDVIPCFFMPVSYGSVWTSSLREIHRRMLATPLFAAGAPTCVAAYDADFAARVIAPCFEDPQLREHVPVPIEKHPQFSSAKNTLDI